MSIQNPFASRFASKGSFAQMVQENIKDDKDGLKEVDVVSMGKSIRVPFRNHELLNAVMLREDAQILRVLLTDDSQRLVYLRKDKVCVRMLGDMHTPLDQVGPEGGTEFQSIAISKDDRFLAVGLSKGGQNEVRVLNIGTLKVEKTFAEFESQGSVRYLQFSPDGDILACGHSSSTIYLFNMRDDTTKTLNGHSSGVSCIKFLRDTEGQLVSGSASGELLHWNYEEGQVIRRMSGHGGCINGICITQRDEEVFSAGTDGKTVYQRLNGGVLHTFTEARNHNCCGVTSDDRFLLVGTDNSRIVIWNTETKERVVALIEHGRGLKDICISSDDRYFVSCGNDQTIFLMGLVEKKMRGRMKGHTDQIYSIDISPDNRFLASGGMDKVTRIWDTKTMKQVH